MAWLLAAALSAAAVSPVDSRASGDSYTRSGTFHIDQFGEYDINADVTVTDGVITGLDIKGDNFGGTYQSVNKVKLADAIQGMMNKVIGLSDTDVDGLRNLDAVSGATYTSNGIKEAVAEALQLSLKEEEDSGIPGQAPEAGTYDVTVAVRSDVVDHSLVRTATAPAVLKVDRSGKMTLAYTMVSGTEQEPMYILGFNGYYKDNDPLAELCLDGVEFKTEEKGGYTVVTDVAFPLSGISRHYYNNTRIYVPAMSNLNGEINGIYFENGKFSVKTIVTVDWSSLKKQEGIAASYQESMDVTAAIAPETSAPSYGVTVPAALDMGKLESARDNIQDYEISVNCEEAEGTVTVAAPETGALYAADKSLSFSNDFGTRSFQAREIRNAGAKEAAARGRIVIAGADVEKAAPGNYTGTTTFSITYSASGTGSEDAGDEELDVRKLKDGVYAVNGTMIKTDKTSLSMADRAINHTIKLTVKNGKYFLTVNFKGLQYGNQYGYLSKLKYFLSGYTADSHGAIRGDLADVTVDSWQTDEKGNRVKDSFGTDYPDHVTFEMIPEALEDGFVPLQVFVPVMESIAEGTGTQAVYLSLDWSTLKAAAPDDPAFEDDGTKNDPDKGTGGSSLAGGSTLAGGSSLTGGMGLGKTALGSGGTGLGSAMSGGSLGGKLASGVKTGDAASYGGWLAVLAVSSLILLAGAAGKWKRKNKRTGC